MSSTFNRRDFLKLGGLLPASLAAPAVMKALSSTGQSAGGSQNVIIVVFDAFSAYNISLYGYSRDTMPNMARLAKKAVVYHNHFAGSNFTTSGTASLLTGTLPWTHRALQPNHTVDPSFVNRNIFTAFKDYYRLAYTHNGWAWTLLRQFQQQMDDLIPRQKLLLGSYDTFIESLFRNDDDISTVSWARDMRISDGGYAYSLFLSRIYKVLQEGKVANLEPLFPRGIPTTGSDNGFLLEQAVDWIGDLLTTVPQPIFGYFHFLPPHFPYRTSVDFYNRFRDDGYTPVEKPLAKFAQARVGQSLLGQRTAYDEFILYVDREFARFYDALEKSGLLANSWVVFTSDHGEMFERGIMGHSTDALYQPVIRIPLMVFEPGREQGMDIYTPTSAVDLLPTLAQVTGHPIPEWTEGVVMPPYSSSAPDPKRKIYVVRAHDNAADLPLTRASVSLVSGHYKVTSYFGYQDHGIPDFRQLFNVEKDPEELINLQKAKPSLMKHLMSELRSDLEKANKPYLDK